MSERKKLYKLANIAQFSVSILGIFNRVKGKEEILIWYGTKYIYAYNENEAVMKFKEKFKHKISNDKNLKLHSPWLFTHDSFDEWSDNAPLMDTHYKIDKIQYDVAIMTDDSGSVDIKTLATRMSAEDFKEWWHDKEGGSYI